MVPGRGGAALEEVRAELDAVRPPALGQRRVDRVDAHLEVMMGSMQHLTSATFLSCTRSGPGLVAYPALW